MPKTRFVCISDTHGYTPSEAGFKLPAGDVLIHAGDLTNQGSKIEIEKTINWISKTEYQVKIIVAGNHDTTLDPITPHSNDDQDLQKYLELLLSSSPQMVYLNHQAALIRLTRPTGPRAMFKIFGSPYSRQISRTWAAFGYEADDAEGLWSQIPLDADIVVTHTPPHSHLDTRGENRTGCKALNRVLRQVRPCLAVCGHVHEARGVERVRWGVDSFGKESTVRERGYEGHNEDYVERVAMPPSGSKKQCIVDLTGRKERKLDSCGFGSKAIGASFSPEQNIVNVPSSGQDDGNTLKPPMTNQQVSSDNISYQDDEYLRLRSLRRETCIVNSAIMATSWPHRGGKKFNSPIVVDLELPEADKM
ncbi:hypothetical protein PHISCL_01231 [Aspergillus sclerotialis]|uniref:Calcineurin-like phosphoesterase domain-containing protein n=1 Tax=Aspergillus sclerotialis TaxID=2070753 RepID=A0A3A2ZUN9_9EURO|nr:hypothetical protein PHISCL_01231 [Aspergillus sclerotialis]